MKKVHWFIWNIAHGSGETLVALFEEQLRQIESTNRPDWLTVEFSRAWDSLPESIIAVIEEMIDLGNCPRPKGMPGRKKTSSVVAERLGVNQITVWRLMKKAKLEFLLSLVPDDAKPKCKCGCGMPTSFAYVDNVRFSHRVGQPVAFLPGHNARL